MKKLLINEEGKIYALKWVRGRFPSRLALVLALFAMSVPSIALAEFGGAPTVPDEPGQYKVGIQTYSTLTDPDDPGSRLITGYIWYPTMESGPTYSYYSILPSSLGATLDAEPVHKKFPIVFDASGRSSTAFTNAELNEHLASHGFVVISSDWSDIEVLGGSGAACLERYDSGLRLLNYIEERDAAGSLAGTMSLRQIGMMGNSEGAQQAFSLTTGNLSKGQFPDPKNRIKALVFTEGANDACNISHTDRKQLKIPYLTIAGSTYDLRPDSGGIGASFGLGAAKILFDETKNAIPRYKVELEGNTHLNGTAGGCRVAEFLRNLGLINDPAVEPLTDPLSLASFYWNDIWPVFLGLKRICPTLGVNHPILSTDLLPVDGINDYYEPTTGNLGGGRVITATPAEVSNRAIKLYVTSFLKYQLEGKKRYKQFLTEDFAETVDKASITVADKRSARAEKRRGNGSEHSPKRLILYMGDGMGLGHVALGEAVLGREMEFQSFRAQNSVVTASANTLSNPMEPTDSAAAATALATGQKSYNGVISVADPGDGSDIKTVMEEAKARGMSIGLVTTSYFYDASPAAFAAHTNSRDDYCGILSDYFNETKPDLILGFNNNAMDNVEKCLDGSEYDIKAQAEAEGYKVVTSLSELRATDRNEPLILGAFGWHDTVAARLSLTPPFVYVAPGTFPDTTILDFGVTASPAAISSQAYFYLEDIPRLTDMIEEAIDILDRNPNGYMLFIENESTDQLAHFRNWFDRDFICFVTQRQLCNNPPNSQAVLTAEMAAVDDEVKTILENIREDKNTLLLVTADHETGGLYVTDTEPVQLGWNDSCNLPIPNLPPPYNKFFGVCNHTTSEVGLWAYGKDSQMFDANKEDVNLPLDNTELSEKMREFIVRDDEGISDTVDD